MVSDWQQPTVKSSHQLNSWLSIQFLHDIHRSDVGYEKNFQRYDVMLSKYEYEMWKNDQINEKLHKYEISLQ
jgi:hypothetical protein